MSLKSLSLFTWALLFIGIAEARPTSLVLVGDTMTGRGVTKHLGSPASSLVRWKSTIASADYTVANLEAAPQSSTNRTQPNFQPAQIGLLRAAGFDALDLANNHSLDSGANGFATTLAALKKWSIAPIGLNSIQSGAATATIKGHRFVFLAATQHGPFEAGGAQIQIAHLESQSLLQAVREHVAKGEFVVVLLHWGREGVAAPEAWQRTLARQLIGAGAIAVCGHHSHISGQIETYKNRPIFYSLGNFLWDSSARPQSGLLARLEVDGDTPQTATVTWKSWSVESEITSPSPPPTPAGEVRKGCVGGHFLEHGWQWAMWTQSRAGKPLLRLLERDGEGFWHTLALGNPLEVRRLEAADVDSDGRDEVVVELFQRSKLDPNPKRRLHVYSAERGRGFVPLWRGSTLSRPFISWTLVPRADGPGRDLLARERGFKAGEFWLSRYAWNGFGFKVVDQKPIAAKPPTG